MPHPLLRIALVERDDYSPEQAELANGRDIYNLTRMMVNHPDLYRVFIPLAEKLMRGSLLPPREREILLIRTLELCRGAYEAQHHDLIARSLGMSEAEIDWVKKGGSELSGFDRTLVKAADELIAEKTVSDETWRALAQRYTVQQLMEVVFLVGAFAMISMVTNSLGVPTDAPAAHG